MNDLIKQLRDYTVDNGDHLFHPPECQEAADALERSQAQIDALQQKVHLCAGYDRLEAALKEISELRPDHCNCENIAMDALEFAVDSLPAQDNIALAFVKRIAKQPLLEELPEHAEGGDPEGAYDIIVYEAREALNKIAPQTVPDTDT